MKHGPIALLDESTPVVCVATDSPVLDKVLSNVAEVRARGADVIAVATEGSERGRRGRRPDALRAAHRLDPAADPRDRPAPAARLPRRPAQRAERRPAAQPGEDGHGRVVRRRPGRFRVRSTRLALSARLSFSRLRRRPCSGRGCARPCGMHAGRRLRFAAATPPISASLVPPPTRRFYVEAVIRPGRRPGRTAIGAHRAGRRDRRSAGRRDRRRSTESFAEAGVDLTYADDIEPWLGDRAAAFVSWFEAAGRRRHAGLRGRGRGRPTPTPRATRSSTEGRRRDGERRRRRIESRLPGVALRRAGRRDRDRSTTSWCSAPSTAFKDAVDASEGESLADSEESSTALDALPDDSVSRPLYLEPRPRSEAQIAGTGLDRRGVKQLEPARSASCSRSRSPRGARARRSVGVSARLRGDGRLPAATDQRRSPPLVACLGGSWFGVAMPRPRSSSSRRGFEVELSSRAGRGSPAQLEPIDALQDATGLDLEQRPSPGSATSAGFVQGTRSSASAAAS